VDSCNRRTLCLVSCFRSAQMVPVGYFFRQKVRHVTEKSNSNDPQDNCIRVNASPLCANNRDAEVTVMLLSCLLRCYFQAFGWWRSSWIAITSEARQAGFGSMPTQKIHCTCDKMDAHTGSMQSRSSGAWGLLGLEWSPGSSPGNVVAKQGNVCEVVCVLLFWTWRYLTRLPRLNNWK